MRSVAAVACFLLMIAACGRGPDESSINYDSFHSVAMDGTIEHGVLETSATSDDVIKDQIIDQLHYSVGLLNTWMSVGDLARTLAKSVTIGEKTQISENHWRVHYRAEMTVSWSRAYQAPGRVDLVLPYSVDAAFDMPRDFFDRYATASCLDPSTHALGLGNFWYYIRPYNQGCPLAVNGAEFSVRFPMTLRYSGLNTNGRAPEYGKFWEDGRLTVTAVFSKNAAGENPRDIGLAQYNQFYFDMIRAYGWPVTVSERVPAGGPGLQIPALTLEFRSRRGMIEVHMFLVDGMSANGESFDERFGAATLDSDLVMYNGHAGLGSNVRGLARKIQVRPGQYQLFMLNGCDTFAYIDDEIMAKHKAANPDATDYKFVDIIANSMPSYFTSNSNNSMVLINAAVNSRLTYRDILSYFDPNQRAVVFGEEDNL